MGVFNDYTTIEGLLIASDGVINGDETMAAKIKMITAKRTISRD